MVICLKAYENGLCLQTHNRIWCLAIKNFMEFSHYKKNILGILSVTSALLLSSLNFDFFIISYYAGIFLFTLLTLLLFLISIFNNSTYKESKYSILEIGVIAFLVVFAIFLLIRPAIHGIYQFVSWTSSIMLYYIIRKLIDRKVNIATYIHYVFITYGIIHSLFVIGQYIGLFDSIDNLYEVTGFHGNPNASAISLVIPFWSTIYGINRIKSKRVVYYLYILFIVIFTISIIILKCRAVYIAIIISISYYLFKKYRKRLQQEIRKPILYSIVLLITISGAIGMYNFKKESSDGRLLLWKNSISLLSENLLVGVGPGVFAKAYSYKQAEYFKNKITSNYQKKRARILINPLNEYLRITLEFGVIIGGILIFCFFYAISRISTGNYLEYKIGLYSIAIISLFNYSFFITTVLAQISIIFAVVDLKYKKLFLDKSIIIIYRILGVTILSTFLFYNTYTTLKANEIKNSDNNKVLKILEDNSEIFTLFNSYGFLHAKELFRRRYYIEALDICNKQLNSTANYETILLKGDILLALGKYKQSEEFYNLASNMLPGFLRPRVKLANLYIKRGDASKAVKIAEESLDIGVIVDNEKTKKIIKRLRYIKNNY